MKRLFFLLFISVILLSCGTSSSDYSNIFRYNEKDAGISTLDPIMANDMHHNWIFNMLYNGLVSLDNSLNVVPAIAKSWTVNESGTEYVFHLRDDVFFHDHPLFPEGEGRKVKAKDFEASFKRIIEEKRGLSTFTDRLKKTGDSNGIKAMDDFTLKISLESPFPPLLGVLAMQNYSVLPVDLVDKLGEDFRANPIGTGPFKFAGWTEESRLVVIKNDSYFEIDKEGESLPYLDGVEVTFIKDPYSEYMNFKKGSYDMISGIEGAVRDQLIDENGKVKEKFGDQFVMDSRPFLNTEYLGFIVDGEDNVYNNKYLRQAINYTIDRRNMIRFIKNGMGQAAENGFVPRGFADHNPDNIKGYKLDLDKARILLEAAGYPGGKGLPEVVIYTTPTYKELCEFMQYQLKQIGIPVKVEVNSPLVTRENVSNGTFKFFRKSWIADYPDPENYLSLFYSKFKAPIGPNYTHFNSPVYDSLYLLSLNTLEAESRKELYEQMDQMIMDEAPVVPLFYDVSFRLYQKNITGLNNNPINLLDLRRTKKLSN
ncbi:ABC transporter substrate-binding protein [Flavobacteriales bacterium]|nr:ABC transporter substrate-binding protein [Flavobacteriales bacterium]